jgi:hypothetical protein
VQNELRTWHVPSVHNPEQHSVLPPQGLPELLQARFNAVQVPLSQWPPQHSAPELQAAPSATQAAVEHEPPWQLSVEHSVPLWHVAPGVWLAVGTVELLWPLEPAVPVGSVPVEDAPAVPSEVG